MKGEQEAKIKASQMGGKEECMCTIFYGIYLTSDIIYIKTTINNIFWYLAR